MKIYFIGSQSVGKTTLARYVANKYKLTMLPEVARQILAEKELKLDLLRTNLDIVDDFQWEIFTRQIQQETKYSKFVSDRSFDCIAYAAQHSTITSKIIKSDNFKKYINSLKESNVIIFFVRPCKETLCNDGVRENVTWDGVVAIDAMIKILCKMFDIKVFQINSANMQERTDYIDSVLSLFIF
jgi:dephospho-CoA kinase